MFYQKKHDTQSVNHENEESKRAFAMDLCWELKYMTLLGTYDKILLPYTLCIWVPIRYFTRVGYHLSPLEY